MKLREIEDRWLFSHPTIQQKTEDIKWLLEDKLKQHYQQYRIYIDQFNPTGIVFCFEVSIDKNKFRTEPICIGHQAPIFEFVRLGQTAIDALQKLTN